MTPRVLLLDNYDSFVGNLYQYLGELGAELEIHRNDALSVPEVLSLRFTHLVLSPGPGRPEEAGISVPLIRALAGRIPILGVCLGHQAIGLALGARVGPAKSLRHGKSSPIHHLGTGLFADLPSPFTAGRYHSLAVLRDTLPAGAEVTAWTEDGEVMGIRRRGPSEAPVEGLQFHPESILSEHGHAILARFLELEPGGRP